VSRVRLTLAAVVLAALAFVPSAFAGPGLPFSGQDDIGFNADIGSTDTATLSITNSDTVPHLINTITTSGDLAFSNGNGCDNTTLNPGDQCLVGVTFQPGSVGIKTAQLIATYDGGSTQGGVSELSGVGTNPPATLPPTFSPGSHDFGSQTIGQAGASVQYTVHNPNLGSINMTSITMAGANPGAFKKPGDSCSGSSLAGGSDCTFTIRYYPSGAGGQSAIIQIADSIGTQQINVSGTGSRPAAFTGFLGSVGCTASTLTWNVANGTFGSWIVRNASHAPTGPLDGARQLRTSTGVLLDGNLKQFHTYYYAIYAQYKTDMPNGNGQVVYSDPKRIALKTGRICKPQHYAHISSTTPLINWTAVSGSTAYGIKIQNHGVFIQSKFLASTKPRYQVPASWTLNGVKRSLKHGQQYAVFVFSYSKKHPNGVGIGSTTFTIK
jgi:hypothetical protein